MIYIVTVLFSLRLNKYLLKEMILSVHDDVHDVSKYSQ